MTPLESTEKDTQTLSSIFNTVEIKLNNFINSNTGTIIPCLKEPPDLTGGQIGSGLEYQDQMKTP